MRMSMAEEITNLEENISFYEWLIRGELPDINIPWVTNKIKELKDELNNLL